MSQPMPDTPRPTRAPHPFDLPSGDLILRTADLVDFHVHTLFLSMASPFFAAMLALPQPATNTMAAVPEAPVVPVFEDSATLELLLRLVYPISKPRAKMEDPQMIVPALHAAAKYEMELPVDILSERLVAIIPNSPLQVWAAACRTGLEDVARQAAVALRTSWVRDGTKEVLSFMDDLGDMSGISAADYFRLKQFLKAERPDEEWLTLLSPPIPSPLTPQPPSPESILPFSTRLPSPDVVCRSSSRMGAHTEFAAHQVVLCMCSPVLEARLAELRDVPLSNDSQTPPPIVLDFEEEADVLSSLLKACYEREEDLLTDLELVSLAELLCACRKYRMARIARWVHAAWDRESFRRPLEAGPIVNAYEAVMENAPALVYHRLLTYFDACREASRGPFVQASSRMHDNVYLNDSGYFYLTDIKEALNSFDSAAHILSPAGASRSALNTTLTESLSRSSTLVQSAVWRGFLHPLIECMTSVPDAAAAAVNDIQIILT